MRPEDTLNMPWADVVELLEARSQRMERAQRQKDNPYKGEHAIYTDNLAELGLGMG